MWAVYGHWPFFELAQDPTDNRQQSNIQSQEKCRSPILPFRSTKDPTNHNYYQTILSYGLWSTSWCSPLHQLLHLVISQGLEPTMWCFCTIKIIFVSKKDSTMWCTDWSSYGFLRVWCIKDVYWVRRQWHDISIPQPAATPLFRVSSLFVKNIPLLVEASDKTYNDDEHEQELQIHGPCVNFMKSMHHQFGTNGNGWRWIRFYARRRFWFLPSMPAGITARMEEASFLDWGIAAG